MHGLHLLKLFSAIHKNNSSIDAQGTDAAEQLKHLAYHMPCYDNVSYELLFCLEWKIADNFNKNYLRGSS